MGRKIPSRGKFRNITKFLPYSTTMVVDFVLKLQRLRSKLGGVQVVEGTLESLTRVRD